MPSPDFDNSFARLGQAFYTRLAPTPVAQPSLLEVNEALANHLQLDVSWLQSESGLQTLAGNATPDGADPLAAVYAGHQFGNYNPQLGDGRAILLGEVLASDGSRVDIQLKGSGPTPYSRGGDGRSPLGPVLREYIVSEAMHSLGVPTTRALAAVSTGETVYREQALPGAVLARVASSHIRIGTFQYFAAQGDKDSLLALTQYVIDRHYPDAADADNCALALLQQVIKRQAKLVANWQLLGFIHGVMNTDNMLLCAETIDYGPCAFMDHFNPEQVFSSIDHGGRYAYRNQPAITQWNLAKLAQSLLPLMSDSEDEAVALAQSAIDDFPSQFLRAHGSGLATKLGLTDMQEHDTNLVESLFSLMAEHSLDFTVTFRQLAELAGTEPRGSALTADFPVPAQLDDWIGQWRQRLAADTTPIEERSARMYRANPAFIPRNHLVERAIQAAYNNDLKPFRDMLTVGREPHVYHSQWHNFARPPEPTEVVRQTFCGT